MPVPPDPSDGDDGSLLASSPSRSLPEVRFVCIAAALYVVSPFRLHRDGVFKVLSSTPHGMVAWYGRSTVPVVVKSCSESDLISFSRVDLESPLMLDFFINSTIFGPFAMNDYISFLVSNPGKTQK